MSNDDDDFEGLVDDSPATVREELLRKLRTEGARVAINTMLEVAQDKKAQASARATCATGLLRASGYFSKKAEEEADAEDKSPDQMTMAELEREVRRIRARRLKLEAADAPDDGALD